MVRGRHRARRWSGATFALGGGPGPSSRSAVVRGHLHARTDGETHVDVAWGYDDPLPESAGVQGFVCFYDEKVDVEIDGEPQGR